MVVVVVVVVAVVPEVLDDVLVVSVDAPEDVDDVVELVVLDEVSMAVGGGTAVVPLSDRPEVAVLKAVVIEFTVLAVDVEAVAADTVPEPSVIVGVAPTKFDGADVTVPAVGDAASTIVPPEGTVFVTPEAKATLPPVLFMLMLDPEILALCVIVPKELSATGPAPPLIVPPTVIVLPAFAVGAARVTPFPAETPPLPMLIGLLAVISTLPEAVMADAPLVTPPVLSRLKLPPATLMAPNVKGAPCFTVRLPATET